MKYLFTLGLLASCLQAGPITYPVYNTPVESGDMTGTRSVGSGGLADGGGTDYDNLTLDWNIALVDQTYEYTYTIGGFSTHDLGHLILDLSGAAPISDAEVNGDPATLFFGDWCAADSPCQGASNIGLPNDIQGLKIDPLPSGSPVVVTFTSTQAPVWGDFYVMGGTEYVYNIGNEDHNDSLALDFVARPDPAVAPEPATFGLAGAALLALGLMRRKHRQS
ncbi:MAG TPA: PEP-CTERM sorting domain-containing protein [Bryobacteraceae bacterium]|nr:PEP-CTERM sorting domain-containing protein [Bryobacteraceae bacterium]